VKPRRANIAHARAGFALPMVLLLVLVSGIILAVMMERQTMQTLMVQREMDTYRFHHISRGIQEAVEAWIRSNGTNDIAGALDEEGHAFDLQVEGSKTHSDVVHISFSEAQGPILADFSGLSGDALDAARAVVEKLQEEQGANAYRFVRREGPVAVSVNSAPDEVLKAVLASVLDMQQVNSMLSEIKHAKENGLIDVQTLGGLYDNAYVDAQTRPKIQGLLTAQPVLWQVVAESEPPRGVFPPVHALRYGGLAIIGGMSKTNTLQRTSSFVSWENLGDR
jgi:hypothetical protein